MPQPVSEILLREIASALGLDGRKINPGDRIVTDLGAESLDLVDLTFRIEKSFSIQIPQGELFEKRTSDLQNLTVQDVQDYIGKSQNPPAT